MKKNAMLYNVESILTHLKEADYIEADECTQFLEAGLGLLFIRYKFWNGSVTCGYPKTVVQAVILKEKEKSNQPIRYLLDHHSWIIKNDGIVL